MRGRISYKRRGITLTELLIVIVVIAILATLVMVSMGRAKEKAKLSRVTAELQDIAKAVTQYAEDNNYQYPADTSRSVPPGLEKYLSGGVWPTSIWPHGVFDWDNWTHPGPGVNQGKQIFQITYRLCDNDDPLSYCSDPVLFPHFGRNSAIYYCISGPCIPHESEPTAPGYCVNCKTKEVNPPL